MGNQTDQFLGLRTSSRAGAPVNQDYEQERLFQQFDEMVINKKTFFSKLISFSYNFILSIISF